MVKLSVHMKGLSLFELMLILFFVSILMVTAIQYEKQQEEIKASEIYGQKLYIYGNAVRDYIMVAHNSTTMKQYGYFPGTANTYSVPNYNDQVIAFWSHGYNRQPKTFSSRGGTAWLKKAYAGVNPNTGQPYLDDSFTFNTGLDPLTLATPDSQGAPGATGDGAIQTKVDINMSTGAVSNLIITAGVLYEETSKGKVIRPDLTSRAIAHANDLFSPIQGGPSITYAVPYIQNGTINMGAAITGTQNANSSEVYLRVDGQNSMLAPIEFQAPAAVNNRINNLETLNFDGESSSITNLATLSAGSGSKEITNLNAMTFDGTNSSIDKIAILNFVNAKGVITGLEYSAVFKGFSRIALGTGTWFHSYLSGANALRVAWDSSGTSIPATALCILTEIDQKNYQSSCALYKQNGYWYVATGVGNARCDYICYKTQ